MLKNAVLLISTACVLFTPVLHAGEVQVIANHSVDAASISADDLKRLFLGQKTSVGDSRVEPVILRGGPVHEKFLEEYVGKSASGYRNFMVQQVFTGKGRMPQAFATDAEMAAFVAKTKGAVGYVSVKAKPAGVKILTVK